MSLELVCSVMCSFMLTFLVSPVSYMAWTLMIPQLESFGVIFVDDDEDEDDAVVESDDNDDDGDIFP